MYVYIDTLILLMAMGVDGNAVVRSLPVDVCLHIHMNVHNILMNIYIYI
jgi:ribulose 1,5-bisphosphate carboxylase large subunit-like protein